MPLTPIRIEAELMNLSTYRVESGNTAASEASLYQATGSVGAAPPRLRVPQAPMT